MVLPTELNGLSMDPEEITKRAMAHRDHKGKFTREVWIHAMETKIVQEKLAECYLYEGVNHKQNCAELSKRYLNMLRNYRMEGSIIVPPRKKEDS